MPINPLLGPLTNNLGSTFTHALLAGSPAIDTGDPAAVAGGGTVPLHDQRGNPFSRIFGGRIDLGAFERQGRIVDTLVDEDDGNYTAGDLSLREAIGLVNSGDVAFESTISFADSLTSGGPATILLTMGELLITDTLTTNGPGADLLTIDASGNDPTPDQDNGDGSRLINIDDGNDSNFINVSISGLTLTGADELASNDAVVGAILSRENLTVAECTISGNAALGSAVSRFGAISSFFGSLFVVGSTISGNFAGAGIANGGSIIVTDSTISDNSTLAGGGRGGIAGGDAPIEVTSSTISGNSGGGINLLQGPLTVTNSTISGNTGGNLSGGGIRARGDDFLGPTSVMVTGSTISGNSTLYSGGGISVDYGSVTLAECIVTGNSADGNGGGIFITFFGGSSQIIGFPSVVDSVINGNTAGGAGGGGFSETGLLMSSRPSHGGSVTSSTITGNIAGTSGGGLWASAGSYHNSVLNETYTVPFTVTSSTISGNAANEHGGGAFLSGQVPVTTSTIINNTAGIYGGGIFWDDLATGFGAYANTITLADSTISGNEAGLVSGGIYCNSDRQLNTQSSTISGNRAGDRGGGIYILGSTLETTASTISGNEAGFAGGGVYLRDTVATLVSSTISGNQAREGGGVWHFADDLVPGATSLTISETTISGNVATVRGGGVNNRRGTIAIEFSTVTQNDAPAGQGSGIASRGDTLTRTDVRYTVVAGNASSDVDVINSPAATVNSFQSIGYNLIGLGTAVGSFNHTGDQTGVVDAMLGPLADNGGPTMTHALLEGSPAIDAGDPLAVGGVGGIPLYDQRGRPHSRVYDGDGVGGVRIDIGAFERQNPPVPQTFVVDTLVDEVNGDISTGNLSLREAIGLANGNIAPDVITFAPSLAGGTITLTMGELFITDSLRIEALGAQLLTIDASGNDPTPAINDGNGSRVFTIDNPDDSLETLINVEIVGLTLTGGDVGGFVTPTGGAIGNFDESLTVIDSVISGNSASSGGGIFSDGNLTLTGSTIGDNSASHAYGSGGGITVSGTATIVGSTIRDNEANGGGGGIRQLDGQLAVTESTISGNSATNRGGGIFTYAASGLLSSAIRHSIITNNSAPAGKGGGLVSVGSVPRMSVYSTIVAGNAGSDVDSITGANLFLSEGYNLIGTGNSLGAFNQPGDQTGVVAPGLGPLAPNGGPTKTHSLLPGSPAIDAGDPSFAPPPDFDQRGAPFTRVAGVRIDIGAFELQPIPAAFFGDYNQNGVVDAADCVVWRKFFGATGVTAYTLADGNGDTTIDNDDHGVWTENFGETLPGSGGSGESRVESQELSAEALSKRSIASDQVGEPVVLIPTETTSASASTDAAAARAASFAVLETRSLWQDSSPPSRGRTHRYHVAESGDNDLSLLLAIDRVWRTRRQDSSVSVASENVEHGVDDDDSESEIDEPLAVALVVW